MDVQIEEKEKQEEELQKKLTEAEDAVRRNEAGLSLGELKKKI